MKVQPSRLDVGHFFFFCLEIALQAFCHAYIMLSAIWSYLFCRPIGAGEGLGQGFRSAFWRLANITKIKSGFEH